MSDNIFSSNQIYSIASILDKHAVYIEFESDAQLGKAFTDIFELMKKSSKKHSSQDAKIALKKLKIHQAYRLGSDDYGCITPQDLTKSLDIAIECLEDNYEKSKGE